MTADGYLNFDTKIDTGGFESGLGDISKQLKSLSAIMGKLRTVIDDIENVRFTADISEVKSAAKEIEKLNPTAKADVKTNAAEIPDYSQEVKADIAVDKSELDKIDPTIEA
ncbi:MAG: hypothetical protein IJX77_09635, partial [Ruminococcus sp.]|nr:hypothetical protein [Ruminococcus sp.]